jgi:hypothetical protein
MARWTYGPNDDLVIEATSGHISMDIPAGLLALDAEGAEDVRRKLALAITVSHGVPTS